jgi:septal ring factor EnvC (AmiA/AmiB activator)
MPINSWTINLFGAIILSVMVGGGIYMWKQSVATEALIEYKTKQLEQALEQQKKALEDTRTILKESADIIADLKDKSIRINEKVKGLDVYLDNHKDDKESSEVLKRTFRELSK